MTINWYFQGKTMNASSGIKPSILGFDDVIITSSIRFQVLK